MLNRPLTIHPRWLQISRRGCFAAAGQIAQSPGFFFVATRSDAQQQRLEFTAWVSSKYASRKLFQRTRKLTDGDSTGDRQGFAIMGTWLAVVYLNCQCVHSGW